MAEPPLLQRVQAAMSVFVNPNVDDASMREADAQLTGMGSCPGYPQILLSVLEADRATVPRGIRQLATVLLTRAVIKPHWLVMTSTPTYEVCDEDRAAVRARLPVLLGDEDGRIRAGVAQALAEIAKCDWPERWPQLLDGLVGLLDAVCSGLAAGGVVEPAKWFAADGAIKCLVSFVDSAGSEEAALLANALLPRLLPLASIGAAGAGALPPRYRGFLRSLQAAAFDVMRSIVQTMEVACADSKLKKTVLPLLVAALPPLLRAASEALALPTWDGPSCLLKGSALRTVAVLVASFPNQLLGDDAGKSKKTKKPKATGPNLLAPVLEGVMRLGPGILAAYVTRYVDEDSFDDPQGASDDEKDELAAALGGNASDFSPANVVEALLHLVQTVAMAPEAAVHQLLRGGKAAPVVLAGATPTEPPAPNPRLLALCALIVSCCQVSDSQTAAWSEDPSAYVRAEEEETRFLSDAAANPRAEAKDALADILDVFGDEALVALTFAVSGALGDAASPVGAALRGQGLFVSSLHRWKVIEAGLYVMGGARRSLSGYTKSRAAFLRGGSSGGAGGRGRSKRAPQPVPALAIDLPSFTAHIIHLLQTGAADAFGPADGAEARREFAPYVLGRALWAASRLATSIPDPALRSSLLNAAVETLVPTLPVSIRFAGVEALSRLVKQCPEEVVGAASATILQRLTPLLLDTVAAEAEGGSAEDALPHLTQLTTRVIVLGSEEAAAAAAPDLSRLFMGLWLRHAASVYLAPLLVSCASALVCVKDDRAAAAVTSNVQAAVDQIIAICAASAPTAPATPGPKPPSAAGGAGEVTPLDAWNMCDRAMELLGTLFRRAWDAADAALVPGAVPGAAYLRPPPPLLRSLRAALALVFHPQNTERRVLCAVAGLLAAAVRTCGPALLEDADTAKDVMHALMLMLAGTKTEDRSDAQAVAIDAAPLAAAVLTHWGPAYGDGGVGGLIRVLVPPVATRLAASVLPTLAVRMMMVLAHAVLTDAGAALPALLATAVPLPPTGPLAAGEGAPPPAAPGAPVTQPAVVVFLRGVSRFYHAIESPLIKAAVTAATLKALPFPGVFDATSAVAVAGDREAGQAAAAHAEDIAALLGGGKRRTRSKGKLVHALVPLPIRLLGLVIGAWAEKADAGEDEDEDGDDEEDEDDEEEEGGDDDDAAGAAAGGGGRTVVKGRSGATFMSAAAAAALYGDGDEDASDSGDDDGFDEREKLMLTDLLGGGDGLGTGINLEALLRGEGVEGSDCSDPEVGSDAGMDGAERHALADVGVWDDGVAEDLVRGMAEQGEGSSGGGGSVPPQRARPVDPVIRAVFTEPLGPKLGEFLGSLVGMARSAPAGPVAHMLQLAAAEVDARDKELFTARFMGPA